MVTSVRPHCPPDVAIKALQRDHVLNKKQFDSPLATNAEIWYELRAWAEEDGRGERESAGSPSFLSGSFRGIKSRKLHSRATPI